MTKGLIKVHYKGKQIVEHLWAKMLSKNTARLENIPFQDAISLHDIVRIDNDYNVIKILEKKTKRASVKYKVAKTINEDWKSLLKYFRKNKIEVEGVTTGYASLAVPLTMKKDELKKIVKESPVKVSLY